MFGIAETARRFGQYRWAELQLFELLGQWARAAADASVVAMFAAHSHHHAWHADLFAARTPAVHGLGPAADIAPLPELVPLLAAARAADGTPARVHSVYEALLPALAAEYEHHLALTDPRIDGPTVRVLTLALRDLTDERHQAAAVGERVR